MEYNSKPGKQKQKQKLDIEKNEQLKRKQSIVQNWSLGFCSLSHANTRISEVMTPDATQHRPGTRCDTDFILK